MVEREIGYIRYPNHIRRIQDWGVHCDWPPGWIEEGKLRGYTEAEKDSVFQGVFQLKVREALSQLYGIEAEKLSIRELMEYSKEYGFWIQFDGTVTKEIPQRGGWIL